MATRVDDDVRNMTPQQLRQEVMKLRKAFTRELSSTGNRRCWINLLEVLPEGRIIKPLSLSRKVFIKNCECYYDRNK